MTKSHFPRPSAAGRSLWGQWNAANEKYGKLENQVEDVTIKSNGPSWRTILMSLLISLFFLLMKYGHNFFN
jgi:hypothetical protein